MARFDALRQRAEDNNIPFLGIHLTRRVDGQVRAGPNAALALARAGYRRRDVDLAELVEVMSGRPFRCLARRYWRTGLVEMGRDWSKEAFLRAVRRYLPGLCRRDLTFGPSGVRAQAVDGDGNLLDDFRLEARRGLVYVANAPSSAATACLAMADRLAEEAVAHLALGA